MARCSSAGIGIRTLFMLRGKLGGGVDRAEPFGRAHDEAWRSERRAFGMSDYKAQMANLKSEIRDLKFLA